MTCFQNVISRLGLTEHAQNDLGMLHSLLVVADGSGADTHANAAREAVRRLQAAGVGAFTLLRVKQMLNTLEAAIDAGK
jgi:hypothetical protein